MVKKYISILALGAVYFGHAQDISVIKNSIEIYSENSFTGSSRFNAMAGSMGALGGDISVINTNPAGIGVFITGDINATLSIQNHQDKSSMFGRSISQTKTDTDLGQAGGVGAFMIQNNSGWKFVNVGVNFISKSINNFVETPGSNSIQINSIDNTADTYSLIDHVYDRSGYLTKMSFAVGANYDNKLYFGAGLHLQTVSLDQADKAIMLLKNDSDFYNKQNTPYSDDATAFSANIGVIARVSNQFRVGLAIETPTWWSIDRAYNYYDIVPDLDRVYYESRDFRSPTKGIISAAYVPNKNFAINVDYSLGLSKPHYSSRSREADTELNSFYSDNYKSVSEIKAGAEYRVKKLRVRVGYAYASNPFGDIAIDSFGSNGETLNRKYNNLIVSDKNTIGVGLGYDFRTFYLDAAYQNISTKYANPFLFGGDGAGYYSFQNAVSNLTYAVSEVKNTQNIVTLTLGWRF